MLTPVQQTPLPLEPARQQITPTPPVEPPPPMPVAQAPLQPPSNPQDQFNPQSGSGGRSPQDRAQEDQQQAETAGKMRLAWARLNQLQELATEAASSGNAHRAMEVAMEAAAVASDIRDLASGLPIISVGAIDAVAEQLAQQQSSGGGTSAAAAPTILDSARAGLGTAKNVVDMAASVPYHPVEDRIAINGLRHQVLDAMAGVEAIAARIADASTFPRPAPAFRYDIKA